MSNTQLVHAHAVSDDQSKYHFIIRHLPTLLQFINFSALLGTAIYVIGQGITAFYILPYYVILVIIQEIPAQVFTLTAFIYEPLEEIKFALHFTRHEDSQRGFKYINWMMPIAIIIAVQWKNFANAKTQ